VHTVSIKFKTKFQGACHIWRRGVALCCLLRGSPFRWDRHTIKRFDKNSGGNWHSWIFKTT